MYSPSTFPVGMLKLKSRSKDLYLLLVLDIGLEGARLEGSGGDVIPTQGGICDFPIRVVKFQIIMEGRCED